MGIYDRDYARTGSFVRIRFGGDASVVKWIIAANIVVYVLQLITFGSVNSITNWFQLDLTPVQSGQVWRLVSYGFCHDPTSPWHILFNMLVLYWFGTEIDRMYGSREFAFFYFASLLMSAFAFLAIEWLRPSNAVAIGASGAVMAALTVFTLHFPRHVVRLFGIVPVECWMILLFYVVFDLHPVLLALGGHGRSDGVAHAAHLGGLAFGGVYFARKWRLSRFFSGNPLEAIRIRRPRLFRKSPQLKVYREERDPPDPSRIDERVDQLLEKISKQGEASLTEEERKILFEASRRYRQRRS